MRHPGIEPGSIAWMATMLTFTPPTLLISLYFAAESFNFFWNDDDFAAESFISSLERYTTDEMIYIIPPLVTFENSNFLL